MFICGCLLGSLMLLLLFWCYLLNSVVCFFVYDTLRCLLTYCCLG